MFLGQRSTPMIVSTDRSIGDSVGLDNTCSDSEVITRHSDQAGSVSLSLDGD